jgi:hypothetical protein
MHPRNQPQRMRKPGGRVSEAVTSAGSVVTIPASVRDSRASNAGGDSPPVINIKVGLAALAMSALADRKSSDQPFNVFPELLFNLHKNLRAIDGFS